MHAINTSPTLHVGRGARECKRCEPPRDDNDQRNYLPRWLIDELAERKITGGYDVKNVCPTCRVARSANGTCACIDE